MFYHLCLFFFFLMIRRPPRSTLFPYTTLFRSLIIPRGGEEFVRWVAERSRVPVLKHDKGVVHVFVDADADPEMATAIVLNAKTQRPSVCNPLETLLVDRAIAERFLPAAAARLAEAGRELRGCSPTPAPAPSAPPPTAARSPAGDTPPTLCIPSRRW